MLVLAKEGAKLPSTFDLNTLREQPLENVVSISQTYITQPLVHNVVQYIPKPSSSHIQSQPTTSRMDSSSLALQQGIQLGPTKSLGNNTNLGTQNTSIPLNIPIPQHPQHPNIPLTSHPHNKNIASTFHAQPYPPLTSNAQSVQTNVPSVQQPQVNLRG